MAEPLARAVGWTLAAAIGATACSPSEPGAARPGSLQVEWVGSDTGKLVAPVVAEWCDSLGLLELRAIGGDTGVALVLYPPDSVGSPDSLPPGKYPIVPPQRADSRRPASAVALRWFAETSIRGFRAESGLLTLESAGAGTGAGRFSGSLKSTTEGSRLSILGTFKGLTITPAPSDCAGRATPPDEEEAPLEPDGEEDLDPDADST
jgi:hypothetical protein